MRSLERFLKTVVFILIFVGILAHPFSRAAESPASATTTLADAVTRDDLENRIKARSQELADVNRQLQETQKNLQSTKDQRVTLQRQLLALQGNISQLELGIKSDTLMAQKLSLEIDSMNYDIRDIELSIDDKRSALVKLIQELQKSDQGNLLITFLKNKSLADGFLETQSLKDLRSQIGVDIQNLAGLREELNQKVSAVSEKKQSVEVHQKSLATKKLIVQDQKSERQVILVQTKNKESAYEAQVAELTKQQNAIEDEISAIEDELRAKFDASVLPRTGHGVFTWPIPLTTTGGAGHLTQHFGERSYLYRGKPHNGLDIGAPMGTPVLSAADGIVIAVDNNDRSAWAKYQYGRYVLLKHSNGLATIYGHLSAQSVSVGQVVKRGQVIGYSGKTGYATGPHLHFGVYWAGSIQMKSIPPAAGLVPVGVVVNPEDYL